MKYSTPDIPPLCHGELNVIEGKIRKEKGFENTQRKGFCNFHFI